MDSPGSFSESSQEAEYVPIRVLGRGAFGEAVLYRKLADNSLVVWKEVNLGRLSEKERKDSQNEIDILSMLNHANIVSYYNHFLDEDTLLIEMEYVPYGNLSEKIATQKDPLPEKEVLWYFYQLNSAIAHIHDYGILHRDIKTMNIFMGRSGLLKLGDFGISRMMDSKSGMAQTVVGTPYYMSPELMKGELYNYKSDMWAMGCVLYELLTLTRVFDATNPLKLAYDIVKGAFEEISLVSRLAYSKDLQNICTSLLDKDPSNRPEAEEILKNCIFDSLSNEFDTHIWELNSATRKVKMSLSTQEVQPVVTSQSSEVYFWGGGKMTPQKQEIFTKGRSALWVSAGRDHFAVLTVEKKLYTWANSQGFSTGMVGQLGHGDKASYKAPKLVQAFEQIPIKQVSCGEDFTICASEEGTVYSFGSDYYGCLGVDNEEGDEVLLPIPIGFFDEKPVEQVSCGDAHVVALTKDGEVYTWGCGEFGRLGLGNEDDYATPQKVQIRGGKHSIRSVHASTDGTFLLKTNGRVLACGSNEHNKLGLNNSAKGLRKRKEEISYDIPCKYTFTAVKPLSKYNIVSVSAGKTHTACIDAFGYLITFGHNKYGQLGVGDFKEHSNINVVGGPLAGQRVTKACCGDGFTVIATADNHLYSCGLAENGRLGTLSTDPGGSGPGGQYFALPRPIFGSLHHVSAISCHSWNTVVIAEKVVSQRTIRSTSAKGAPFVSQTSYESLENLNEEEDHFYLRDPASRRNTGTETNRGSMTTGPIATWLQAELNDQFIPYTPAEANQANGPPSVPVTDISPNTMNETVPPWLKQELQDAKFIPLVSNEQKSDGLQDASSPPVKPQASGDRRFCDNQIDAKTDILDANSTQPSTLGTRCPGTDDNLQVAGDSNSNRKLANRNLRADDGSGGRMDNNTVPAVHGKPLAATADTSVPLDEDYRTHIARLEARVSQLELVERNATQRNEDLKCQNDGLMQQIKQLEDSNLTLQEFIEQQAETIKAQAQTIVRLEDKISVLTEIQEEIWKVVDTWQMECRVAMDTGGDHSNDDDMLNSSTLSTDSRGSSFVTDNSHESMLSSQDEFGFHSNQTIANSNLSESARDSDTMVTKVHAGPVMAAVSFFNSMSLALQKSRRKSSIVKNYQQPNETNKTTKPSSDNGVHEHQKSIREDSNPKQPIKYVNREGKNIQNISIDKTSPKTARVEVRPDENLNRHKEYSHYVKSITSPSSGNSKWAFVKEQTNKTNSRTSSVNASQTAQRSTSSSNVDFLFEPRTSYNKVRTHNNKTKEPHGVKEKNNNKKSSPDINERPNKTFKRTRSVPEQMNLQYEIWSSPNTNNGTADAAALTREERDSSCTESSDETGWTKSRSDMAKKSYKPSTINKKLKGVTTSEEVV